MNYRQKRILLSALGILAILVAILFIARACGRGEDAADPDASSSAGTLGEDTNAVTGLEWVNGTSSISLATDENGAWYWTGNPEFPLDASYPDALIATLTGLTPQQTITDGDTLEAYGLDDPTRTLTVTRADGSSTIYQLGKNTTDGASCYLLLAGDDSTVYIIDGALRDQLDVAIYDMMILPALPELPASSLVSLQVTGTADTLLTAVADESDPDADGSAEPVVTWRSQGANVTDSAQALVDSVASLTLSSCADFAPTDQAVTLCGLNTPTAVLQAVYRTEKGEEESFTLSVGNTAADGSGYYVRMDNDPSVYVMTASALEEILSVARDGLTPAA